MRQPGYIRVFLLVLGLAGPMAAQSSLELMGFGLGQSPSGIVSQGIGGIVTVPEGPRGWLYATPSTWYQIQATQLHVSLAASRSRLGDLGIFNRVAPQNFQFLVHVNRRTSYGIGIQPVTRVDMVITDSSGVFYPPQDTLRYVQDRSSVGGISVIKLGLSRRIGQAVSLGVVLNVLFGTLTQSNNLEFLDKGDRDDLSSMVSERRLEFNGQTLGLGLLAAVPPQSRGQLGLQVVLPLALNLVDVLTYINKWDYRRLDPLRYQGVGLPASLVVGYGVDIGQKQRVILESGYSKLWTDEGNDLAFDQHLEATYSLRAGWSRTPSGDEAFRLGRLYYRMGFYRKDYYISALNSPLGEVAFSAGIGFRSRRFGHRVDLTVQVGRRDSLLDDVEFEDFYRLSVGVTTAELWFNRPKKKWD